MIDRFVAGAISHVEQHYPSLIDGYSGDDGAEVKRRMIFRRAYQEQGKSGPYIKAEFEVDHREPICVVATLREIEMNQKPQMLKALIRSRVRNAVGTWYTNNGMSAVHYLPKIEASDT